MQVGRLPALLAGLKTFSLKEKSRSSLGKLTLAVMTMVRPHRYRKSLVNVTKKPQRQTKAEMIKLKRNLPQKLPM
jgi:hypothetical protein